MNKLFIFASFFIIQAQAQQLYVAPNGNDNNAGTIQQPLATIQKAKELIKNIQKEKGLSTGGATVFLRGGNYTCTNSTLFTKENSGEQDKPILYQAYQNEIPQLIGGLTIAPQNWKPLSKSVLKKVHPNVNPKLIVELDVAALGLKNCKQFAPKTQFTTEWFIIDLFANGKRQQLAQFPNYNQNHLGKNDIGYTTCNGSKDNFSFYFGNKGKPQDKDTTNELDADNTNRSQRWHNALKDGYEIWLKGLWRVPWEPFTIKVEEINLTDQSIRFINQPPQGMGSKYSAIASEDPLWRVGSGKENWYALNLLEEIDQPGEWALDTKNQKLYYYPPAPIETLDIMISDMKSPILQINGAQHVQFKNIAIQGGLGTGIEINNSNHIVVAGCNIKNVGNTGISISNGSNHTIQSNNIAETGGWGIEIKNVGNRYQLVSSNVLVNNNHIHHVGKLAFKEALIIQNSVGVTISNNLIHDVPKGSIRTDNINNCLFEYNEIHNIALKEGDTGVFYSYGGWSTYGNIFRYNFSHHTNRANGFYSDDGDSGDFYYKNIVQDCISAVKFGGGHDLIAENNLIIQSKDQTVDDRGKDRNYRLGTKYETNLTQFKINESPWKEYGEKLKATHQLTTQLWSDILKPEWMPELPNGSRMKNNVAIASGKFVKRTGNVEVADNTAITSIVDAQFFDYANIDIRSKNKQILEKFPELNDVFVKIGLQKDAYRKTIPTRKETGGLSNRTNADLVDAEDKMIDKIKPNKP